MKGEKSWFRAYTHYRLNNLIDGGDIRKKRTIQNFQKLTAETRKMG